MEGGDSAKVPWGPCAHVRAAPWPGAGHGHSVGTGWVPPSETGSSSEVTPFKPRPARNACVQLQPAALPWTPLFRFRVGRSWQRGGWWKPEEARAVWLLPPPSGLRVVRCAAHARPVSLEGVPRGGQGTGAWTTCWRAQPSRGPVVMPLSRSSSLACASEADSSATRALGRPAGPGV